MNLYKDSLGAVHALDSTNFEHFLPDGCTAITQEQAHEILYPLPTPQQIIAAKIEAMDDAVRARLNEKATAMDFESIATAILAAGLPVGEYRQDDGANLHLWAARTWQKAAEIRDTFLIAFAADPTIALPTWEEVESELPEYPII